MRWAQTALLGPLAVALLVILGPGARAIAPVGAVPGSTARVSVPNLVDQGTLGTQGNGRSVNPGISDDGRFVVFSSTASNLVANDTNGSEDVFVHDRQTGTTEGVSVDAAGVPAGGIGGVSVQIGGDGRFVVFSSTASNLVPGDTNGKRDTFVRDRQTGTTERVSVDSAEGQADGHSYSGYISDDGQYVTFVSGASSLDGNIFLDVFIRDRQAGTTQLISTQNGDAGGGAISGDSRYIVYVCCFSFGGSSPTVYLYDRLAPSSTTILGGTDATGGVPSDDGRYIAFTTNTSNPTLGDSNIFLDVYLYDNQSGSTELISKDPSGIAGNYSSSRPSLSGDGRFVSFTSDSTNLLAADPYVDEDIFVRDRQTGTTTIVSINNTGGQSMTRVYPSDYWDYSAIDDSGSVVAFNYIACELVVGDTNGVSDIYIHDAGGSGGLPPDADCDNLADDSDPDDDNDGVLDAAPDNCQFKANPLQENNVHPATAPGDHCEDPDQDLDFDIADNCPDTSNSTQFNLDGDSMGDACDPDDDNDGALDTQESGCGTNPLVASSVMPERTDGAFAGVDDDGDTAIDEALPAGADPFDCDGDGYAGTAEAHVFTTTNARDQDSCSTDAWPADFVSGGVPESTNRVNILDLTSFLAPVRHFNTSPPEPEYTGRWDLVPGAGPFSKVINITDLTSIITVAPPMLGGARAFNGPACPWPP